jgi:hypothetical protein
MNLGRLHKEIQKGAMGIVFARLSGDAACAGVAFIQTPVLTWKFGSTNPKKNNAGHNAEFRIH